MKRRDLVADGRMRANTSRHSRDPAHAWLEERPFREIGTSSFYFLDSNPHSPVDLPAKENRKPSVTAPEVSPPVQHLLASKKLVGLARWSAKPGYVLIFSMAVAGWITNRL